MEEDILVTNCHLKYSLIVYHNLPRQEGVERDVLQEFRMRNKISSGSKRCKTRDIQLFFVPFLRPLEDDFRLDKVNNRLLSSEDG